MTDPMSNVPLAAEFPPASHEQWRKLVDGVLKGAPFERKLVAKPYDDLRIEPLYVRDPQAEPVLGRTPGSPWQIIQRLDHPDPALANAQALQDLEGGATGLLLVFAGSAGAHGFGLEASTRALRSVLEGVHLDAGISLEVDGTSPAATAMTDLLHAGAIAPSACQIRFGLDPLGECARGTANVAWSEATSNLAHAIEALADKGFAGPFAAADGRAIHAAGGSEAQELAYVLATAVLYLRVLEGAGHAVDTARRMIFFRLAADADQFLTIAKFRALRKLFARVEQACGLQPEPIFIAAETAWRMMTQRDPWVNVLRTTMAAFAAGLGGADSVTVLPFTAALGLPDAFARRLARNTQLILLEEANLAKVADPAAGSGGLEALTQQLCAATWSLFQEIEAAGGAYAALEGGLVQRKVATTRVERESAVARGRDPLTGTSEFPDIHELPVAVLEPAPTKRTLVATQGIEPLPTIRLAEPFEALRDASDRTLAATGARPKVFLANLGTPSDFTARATFTKNFFEAGGIEAISNDGFTNRADLVAAFKASNARLVCLCSSNEVYARDAAVAAKQLARPGIHIYLAGRPGELEEPRKAAGVQSFIYAGCDMLAVLRAAHEFLGI
ncbi:MAG: methylmalonyl-CoA mutase small subunit, partial [Xanthobacteraceae bacterium]|nr:methylmalonyl-CoA mutase small subunit [Xanthobacteraceae bacterium]